MPQKSQIFKIVSFLLQAMFILLLLSGCKSNDYENAKLCYDNRNFSQAIALLEELGDYKDSKDLLKNAYREWVLDIIDDSKYSDEEKGYASYSERYDRAIRIIDSAGENWDDPQIIQDINLERLILSPSLVMFNSLDDEYKKRALDRLFEEVKENFHLSSVEIILQGMNLLDDQRREDFYSLLTINICRFLETAYEGQYNYFSNIVSDEYNFTGVQLVECLSKSVSPIIDGENKDRLYQGVIAGMDDADKWYISLHEETNWLGIYGALLNFLGEYKDTSNALKRIDQYRIIDYFTEEEFTNNNEEFGTSPHPNTVLLVGFDSVICTTVKRISRGNIYFTNEPSLANLILYIGKNDRIVDTVEYKYSSGNTISVKFYETDYHIRLLNSPVLYDEGTNALYNEVFTAEANSPQPSYLEGSDQYRLGEDRSWLGYETTEEIAMHLISLINENTMKQD